MPWLRPTVGASLYSKARRSSAFSSASTSSIRMSAARVSCTARQVSSTSEEVMPWRSEEHTSELQSLMRISYAVFCLKKKTHPHKQQHTDSKRNDTTSNKD